MKEHTCQIVRLDEKDGFHFMFDDMDNGSIEVYEAIKRTLEVDDLPKGLHLTGGIMNNIWLKPEAYQFWSDKISNFVHETDPGKGPNQAFKFVTGGDGKLVISPQVKVDKAPVEKGG